MFSSLTPRLRETLGWIYSVALAQLGQTWPQDALGEFPGCFHVAETTVDKAPWKEDTKLLGRKTNLFCLSVVVGSVHHDKENIYARKHRKGNASVWLTFSSYPAQRVVLFPCKVCLLPSGNLLRDTRKGVPCHLLGGGPMRLTVKLTSQEAEQTQTLVVP